MEEQNHGQSGAPKPAAKNNSGARRSRIIAIAAIGAVIVAFLVWNSLGSQGGALAAQDNVQVSQAFLQKLIVPQSILQAVKIGAASNFPKKANTNVSLTLNGKPEILYVGAEYCPYCAAQRWAMVIALSRFGNFSSLHYMTSSASDVYASTPTFTFYNSTYTSNYIEFVSVEQTTNKHANGPMTPYQALQSLNESQISLVSRFDSGGAIPFVDFGNVSILSGSTFSPEVLKGKNWSTVIEQVYVANSSISQSVLGSANLMTAQICKATNNTPASVCDQPYMKNIESFT